MDSAQSHANSKESSVASFFTLKIMLALAQVVPRMYKKAIWVHLCDFVFADLLVHDVSSTLGKVIEFEKSWFFASIMACDP